MEFCPSNAGNKVPTLGFEIKNIFTTLVHQNGSDDHDTLLNFLAVNKSDDERRNFTMQSRDMITQYDACTVDLL